jgi:signal transduction histidine kinase
MSAFIVHDLKNLVSQLSLLLANAERHQGNPEFQQDMLATLAHSVRKMTVLLHKLSRGEGPEQRAPLALAEVLAQAVRARRRFRVRRWTCWTAASMCWQTASAWNACWAT